MTDLIGAEKTKGQDMSFDVRRVRPEIQAGGYARDDTTVAFYQRIRALLRGDDFVVDYGAGRSAAADGLDPEMLAKRDFHFRLRYLRGDVARLVGLDIDPVVLSNPLLDEAHVLEPGKPVPIPDATADLVFADWVVEHVEDPGAFEAELFRILKPGGWFCARTPNLWSYIALGAALMNGRMGERVLGTLQPWRKEMDIFPKYYRMNSTGRIRATFRPERWTDASYRMNSMPAYHANSTALFRAFDLLHGLSPSALSTTLMLFLQKRP